MATFTLNPVSDFSNEGSWTFVGSYTSLWQTLASVSDSNYISAPASRGNAAVRYPTDSSSLPANAVISSVSVWLRHSLGGGSMSNGAAPAVSVQLACADNTSYYYSQTVYPTSATPSTIQVASYSRDALGNPWTMERLNQAVARLSCYVDSETGSSDVVRAYELYLKVEYRYAPVVSVTGPQGSTETSSPSVTWTYTQTDGDPQQSAQYQVFTAAQVANSSFNNYTTTPYVSGSVDGDVRTVALPTPLPGDNYWAYVQSVSSYGAVSQWAGRQFTILSETPGVPGVPDPAGVLPSGTPCTVVVPDGFSGSASLTVCDTSNLLSAIDADAEDGVTDGTSISASHCTIAATSSVSFPGGTQCWQMTATSNANIQLISDFVEVAPSMPITARAQFLTAATARSTQVSVAFYDSMFNSVSGTITGTPVTDATATWTSAVATGTTPSSAVYAQMTCQVTSALTSEVHYVDRIGLMYGTNVPWTSGGMGGRNLLSSWYSAAEIPGPLTGEAWTPALNSNYFTQFAGGRGAGTSGVRCHSTAYTGVSSTIGFRAAGTLFESSSTATATLNKPAGTASGDFMIAYVYANTGGLTLSPPSGWTLVDQVSASNSTPSVLWVLKRTAGVSEPGSWTATFSGAAALAAAVVVGYTGCADQSQQFIGEIVASSTTSSPAYLTTPTVLNSDSNAWRVSAFCVNDDDSGTLAANLYQTAAPGTPIPQIQFVSYGDAWYYGDTVSSSYQINKPPYVQSGDFMMAVVDYYASGATLSAPSGWTLKSDVASGNFHQAVLFRFAGASEPAAWSGTISGTMLGPKSGYSAAYRNVNSSSAFVGFSQSAASGAGSSMYTPAVSNTQSGAWRVSGWGAYVTGPVSSSEGWTTSETANRIATFVNDVSGQVVVVGYGDSNSPIETGSTQASARMRNHSFANAIAFNMILNPATSSSSSASNETSRGASFTGSGTSYLVFGAYDSNGVAATGYQSLTGIYTPGDADGLWKSAAGWIGVLRPSSYGAANTASVTMATTVDISNIDPAVVAMAGGTVSACATFLGSTAGTPNLTVNFYSGDQLITSETGVGTQFGTSVWIKSAVSLPMPAGTSRMNLTLSIPARNVSDVVYFDRVGLMLGSSQSYRAGSSRSVHPVWAVPAVQYQDDDGSGYGPWTALAGTAANPPLFNPAGGNVTYTDHTLVPFSSRRYQVRTVCYGLAGDLFGSPWGTQSSEVDPVGENWWLKDIANPANNLQLLVKWDDFPAVRSNVVSVIQPLGEDFPIVLTEGFKSDKLTVSMKPVNHDDWNALVALLVSGNTLFLQSDMDRAWWVRPSSDLAASLMAWASRKSDPRRDITVSFVEVAPVE